MSNQIEWEQLMQLIKLKKENPTEYQQLLKDVTGIMIDMQTAVAEAIR